MEDSKSNHAHLSGLFRGTSKPLTQNSSILSSHCHGLAVQARTLTQCLKGAGFEVQGLQSLWGMKIYKKKTECIVIKVELHCYCVPALCPNATLPNEMSLHLQSNSEDTCYALLMFIILKDS